MRSLPASVLTELAGGTDDTNYLVYIIDLEFSTPKYLTNADIDIYHEGKKYEARGMDFGPVEYSISPTADKVSVDIDDVDATVRTIIQTSEVRGKRYFMRLAALNSKAKVIGTVTHFDGILDSYSAAKAQRSVHFNIYNHMILWKKKLPRRSHTPTCAWTWKDPLTCKYSGGVTDPCDQSWDKCKATYGNQINFGGFRWLPSLVDKQIWWGKIPK